MAFHVPDAYWVISGRMASDPLDGNNGAFLMPLPRRFGRGHAFFIASDGEGWEHVSIRIQPETKGERLPTWDEMCWAKGLFWDEEDCVVQYHPPASHYVNHHPFVLHLWRPTEAVLPAPPAWMIGPK